MNARSADLTPPKTFDRFAALASVEYPLMWGLMALAIFFRGPDRYSLDSRFRGSPK